MYSWPSYWYSYFIAMRCWKEQKFALFFRIVFTFHSKRIKFIWTRWVDSTSTQWYHFVYLCIFKFAQLKYLPFEFKIWGHYTCWHMCLAFIMILNKIMPAWLMYRVKIIFWIYVVVDVYVLIGNGRQIQWAQITCFLKIFLY